MPEYTDIVPFGDGGKAIIKLTLNDKALQNWLQNGESLQDTLAAAAAEGERASKQLAPVDTGNLRRSITHEVGKDGQGQYGRYGTNVEYGLWQEIGTRFHAAQPYLRPALEAVKKALRG